MWDDFFSALALLLILEGIFPFVSPELWRAYLQQMLEMDDKTLRGVGGGCMIMGVFILYLVR